MICTRDMLEFTPCVGIHIMVEAILCSRCMPGSTRKARRRSSTCVVSRALPRPRRRPRSPPPHVLASIDHPSWSRQIFCSGCMCSLEAHAGGRPPERKNDFWEPRRPPERRERRLAPAPGASGARARVRVGSVGSRLFTHPVRAGPSWCPTLVGVNEGRVHTSAAGC